MSRNGLQSKSVLIPRARALRQQAPVPERLLWGKLRNGKLGGVKFRRQQVIGPYIADFYCPAARLVIELDGLSHQRQVEADERRTRFLRKQGLRVIRFSDDQVLKKLSSVVGQIAHEVGVV